MSYKTFDNVIDPDYWYKLRNDQRNSDKQIVIEKLKDIITFDNDTFFEVPSDFVYQFERKYILDLLKEILDDFNKSAKYAFFRLISDKVNYEQIDYIELCPIQK